MPHEIRDSTFNDEKNLKNFIDESSEAKPTRILVERETIVSLSSKQ